MQTEVSAQTVTVEGVTVNVKRGPFGNKFKVQGAAIMQYAGQEELALRVLCTDDSREPGRIYSCNYSLDGDLLACNTLN